MDLKDVRYFVALADARHFTRAAAAVGIAQPSLSRQIKKLETELGAELFHRTKRAVALTSVGRAVLNEARLLLAQAETTHHVARAAAGGERGELRLGFIEVAAFGLLPRLVAAFRRAYPKVAVKLTELSTTEQVTALRERTIDIGILRAPIPSQEVESVPLFREPVAVVLPSHHHLAKRASIKLAALRNEHFIFHSSEKETRLADEIAAIARQQGFLPQVGQHAGEFHTICSLVAAGLGISVVPHSAQAIRISGITYRKLTDPEIAIDYRLGWLRGSRDPVIKAFHSLV
ncbi:MAG: LysR family transcriptional regulator [Alphaproteobacteria bacterium]|nr:LysR family transcriptional regulator [Alphaproteobacteria bacterium]